MASTGSSDVEEDNADQTLSPKRMGRAAEYPEFAIIWSYLENFCELLRFPEMSLDGLEDAFNSHSPRNENCQQLEYLHKKLLVKLHKSFRPDKWEKALLKVARDQNMLSSWDLENFGYGELKVCSKLELFKMLLESQFDCNVKLKTVINKSYEAEELRLQPFGHDMDGLLYWLHMDEVGGVRLYSTEEDEVENESWKLLASDLDELESIVDYLNLKSAINPKDVVLAKKEEEKNNKTNDKTNAKKGKKSKKSVVKEDVEDDNPCARCYSNVRPESILLCDKCDAAYHTACLRPPLLTVPQGDWFCPFCQQRVLLERLKEKRTRLVARQRLRARQAKRLNKSGMNLSNILQGPGSEEEQIDAIRRSGRSRKTVDYTFRDFDEEINDAVDTDLNQPPFDQELNGHPTGKPAFAVQRFYSAMAGKRRSRRLKDLDSGSDTDSKLSEYEYDGSTDEDRPKRPKRHVYLRRHIIEEDDDDDDEGEGERREDEVKMDETRESDEINSENKGSKCDGDADVNADDGKHGDADAANGSDGDGDAAADDDDGDGSTENGKKNDKESAKEIDKDTDSQETEESTLDDSRRSENEDIEDDSSEKSGPSTKPPTLTRVKDTPVSKTSEKNGDKDEEQVPRPAKESTVVKSDSDKKASLEVPEPKTKPPPLERIGSPKIDPLLDSLGFGALASCFTSNERYPARPDPYGTLRSPSSSHDARSPLRPDTGFAADRMGVPSSPSSYPRAGPDSRYTNIPNYGQTSPLGVYFGYNQTDYGSGSYPGSSQTGRQSSYGLSLPGTVRQYPGYPPGISNRESSAFSQTPQSPSINPTSSATPFGNPFSTGYPAPYPGTDAGPRTGYFPASAPSYGLTNKNPYSQPSQGYFPDDPFSPGMFLGNPSSALPQGGGNLWPTPPPGSDSYFPQTGMGQNRTGI